MRVLSGMPLRLIASPLLWASLVLTIASIVASAATSIEDFFRQPEYSSIKMSPDGKSLAGVKSYKGRQNLLVYDIAARKGTLLTSFDEHDVVNYWWANNDRLLFTTGNLLDSWSSTNRGGLFGINKDGSDARIFVPTLRQQINKGQFVYRYASFCCRIAGSDTEVLILSNERNQRSPDVYRLNIYTGRKEIVTLDTPAGNVSNWWPDRSGVVRLARVHHDGKWKVYYRDAETRPWTMLAEYKIRDEGMEPLGFDYDNKTLYMASNVGRDKTAVYTYDTTTHKLKDLVYANDKVDVNSLVFDHKKRRLVGVAFTEDKFRVHWLDDEWKKLQASVDQAYPHRVNVLSRDSTGDTVLVASWSDRQSPTWALYDTQKRTIETIAESRPWIKAADMAETKLVHIPTRDGMTMPAYLTLPRDGGKNSPLVVVPHVGFCCRDHGGFNPEVQFLASRGYAVLQPQFRGSAGFGKKWHEGGYKEWSGRVQDDIADAARWAIAQGIADKQRVCIYGTGFGGYSAAMGTIRYPDVYKCAAGQSALTSPEVYLTLMRGFAAFDYVESDLKEMIGDPNVEKDLFRRSSLIDNADRIQAPMLMAYGGDDHVVPVDQSSALRRALERSRKNVEWVWKSEEGHVFSKPENRIEFYTALERFLARSLR